MLSKGNRQSLRILKPTACFFVNVSTHLEQKQGCGSSLAKYAINKSLSSRMELDRLPKHWWPVMSAHDKSTFFCPDTVMCH